MPRLLIKKVERDKEGKKNCGDKIKWKMREGTCSIHDFDGMKRRDWMGSEGGRKGSEGRKESEEKKKKRRK